LSIMKQQDNRDVKKNLLSNYSKISRSELGKIRKVYSALGSVSIVENLNRLAIWLTLNGHDFVTITIIIPENWVNQY
jgi:hypothetical protein